MRHRMIIVLFSLLLLSSCGPSEQSLQATTTQIAGDLYATQTAQAAGTQAAVSLDATQTAQPPAADPATNDTVADTTSLRSRATPTPIPDKELTEEDLKWMACYQAAVIIKADWAVHEHLLEPYLADSNLDRNQGIQAVKSFSYYRSQRPEIFTIEKGEVYTVNGIELSLGDKLLLNGEEFKNCPLADLQKSRSFLDYHPWMPGETLQTQNPPPIGQTSSSAVLQINTAKMIVDHTLIGLRLKLMSQEQISYSQLVSLEQPIWEAVHNRYGVEFPRYLQGQEVEQ